MAAGPDLRLGVPCTALRPGWRCSCVPILQGCSSPLHFSAPPVSNPHDDAADVLDAAPGVLADVHALLLDHQAYLRETVGAPDELGRCREAFRLTIVPTMTWGHSRFRESGIPELFEDYGDVTSRCIDARKTIVASIPGCCSTTSDVRSICRGAGL